MKPRTLINDLLPEIIAIAEDGRTSRDELEGQLVAMLDAIIEPKSQILEMLSDAGIRILVSQALDRVYDPEQREKMKARIMERVNAAKHELEARYGRPD